MATTKQHKPATRKVKTASARPASKARRAKPGSSGEGEFFHVEIRPTSGFESFRTQDIGKRGGIERVGGRRANGSWDTVKWLISKRLAHKRGKRLVADSPDAREVLEQLGSTPVHLTGDRFKASPPRDIPKENRPATAQRRARSANVKKAARKKK